MIHKKETSSIDRGSRSRDKGWALNEGKRDHLVPAGLQGKLRGKRTCSTHNKNQDDKYM